MPTPKTVFFLALLLWACQSCSNSPSQNTTLDSSKPAVPVVGLNIRDTSFDRFLPDTSIDFPSQDALRTYITEKEKQLLDFSKQRLKQYPDSVMLAYRLDSVSRLIQDLKGYLIIRELWQGEKTASNIQLVAYNNVFSNLVTPEDRMALFNAYPPEVRQGPAGKMVLKMLSKYEKHGDVGKNISSFDAIYLLDTLLQPTAFKYLYQSPAATRLIIFTASWCSPCRYEARQLKSLWSQIDSTQLKVVSISIDKSREKWLQFVRAEASPWPQYLSEGEYESPLVRAIELSSLPLNLLVDARQQIIDDDVNLDRLMKRHPRLFGN